MLLYFLYTGLFVYAFNYFIGWLIYFKFITLGKFVHQIMLVSIITALIILLFYIKLFSLQFVLCSLSLICMLVLPLGKKGGIYHRLVSSAGFVIYILFFLLFLPKLQ